MTHLWRDGLPVTVTLDTHNLPTHLTWLERRVRVQRIVQSWLVDLDWWRPEGRIHRHYVALITADNRFCVLYHDLLTDAWRLVRLYD